MSPQGSHDPTQSQVSSTGRIDQVCDQFEVACRAGNPPPIEEVLLQAPPGERDRLLGELLEIELDFRQRSGAFLQLEEYRGRFPECAKLVEGVFQRVVKTRRLGDYELLEELGHGGMGVVYKARQVYLNQTVALKILPHRYLDDAQAVSRFRREMQSIGGLNHPNIVRAYNAGEAGGVHFLVMEFVDGINLQQFVGAGAPPGGPLGVGAACEITRQAALGLQHAHEHKLVHRDIKPANLMLCRNAGTRYSWSVKLLDLGLAKFHAEWRGDAAPQGRLTQPGVTIGTIDYMAPEQWESSTTADIRSDIYSLGCTLFFLLTGKPPYGDPAYDTSRKKLMAHVVAPIPSLLDNCPDCPQDLEEVYETMMAKDPRERYAVPAEVAEAMAEFADEEELAEVLAAIPTEAWIAASSPNLQNPEADTAKRQGANSVGSSVRRRSQSRRMAKRRFRRNVQIAVFGSLLAVISGLVAWVATRPAGEQGAGSREQGAESGERGAGSGTSAVAGPTTTVAGPVVRTSIAAELALLPGLNGPWWFDETPWLTPFLREAIAEKVQASADLTAVLGDHPHRYLDPNTAEVQKWLWEAAGRCRGDLSPCQLQLLDQLKAYSDGSRDDDEKAARSLGTALQEFEDGHRDGRWSAADLHTVALLEHGIAGLLTDKVAALEAKKSYDKALDAYSAEKKTPASTRLLCLADEAVLCADELGDMKAAKQRMDDVLAAGDLPVLFHVSTLVTRGATAAASATNPGEYEDHRFLYARKLLANAEAVKPNHPLAAHIAERYAWSLMDQWKVEEATKQFQAAYHIRLTNEEEKSPYAAIYVFQNRHGMAMAARYRGNLDAARRTYKSVVDEIKTALAEAQEHGAGQPTDIRSLHQRLGNSLERWADCELYSGAASDGKVNLPQAAENYDQAGKFTPEWSDAVVLGYKRAMVLALNGKSQDAREIVDALNADKRQVLETSKERAMLVKQAAEAVLALKSPNPADGRKLLHNFLDQFKLNPAYRDSTRRETMELQLFAAELLLTWDLQSDAKSAARDLKYLDALLAVFKGRRDIRPYLRRYYELAIRACNKNELVQIAHYLIESRMDERKGTLDSKATLVLFSFTSKDNFAIFLPQDGRAGKRIELGITRDQIKDAKGKPLHLSDDLVAWIKAERDAGRRVEVFWDDTASRPSEDPDALSERDWPFDSQLDLATLQPQANSH